MQDAKEYSGEDGAGLTDGVAIESHLFEGLEFQVAGAGYED